MIAGMEADLAILQQKVLPGLLAAAGAIGASIAIGTFFGIRLFGLEPTSAFFLGLVLSVTAVSVVAKLLMEREALRRIQAITIALFAPIFFGLAGMRVNLFNLRGWGSIQAILVLLCWRVWRRWSSVSPVRDSVACPFGKPLRWG